MFSTTVYHGHQSKDSFNRTLNMVQAYAARDRVATAHLSDEPTAPEDVKSIPLESLLPAVCGRRWGIQRGIQEKNHKHTE